MNNAKLSEIVRLRQMNSLKLVKITLQATPYVIMRELMPSLVFKGSVRAQIMGHQELILF
ncbi:MAG: hypothetical protein EA358_06375 [Flavobacteriales bacterium]|nr:MAG: hypothetical protein EA358_06375 [Flavobacteriales bacterium]